MIIFFPDNGLPSEYKYNLCKELNICQMAGWFINVWCTFWERRSSWTGISLKKYDGSQIIIWMFISICPNYLHFNGPTSSIFFSPPFGHLYLCKSPRTKNTLSNCNYPISKTNIDLLIPASPIYNFGMSQIFLWLKTFQINLISTLLCFRSYKCLIWHLRKVITNLVEMW